MFIMPQNTDLNKSMFLLDELKENNSGAFVYSYFLHQFRLYAIENYTVLISTENHVFLYTFYITNISNR